MNARTSHVVFEGSKRKVARRLVAFGAGLAAAIATGSAVAQPDQPASGEGAAACLGCHENPSVMEIVETPHANFDDPRSPASRDQCESCHGPSATHIDFPMQVGNIRFTKHAKTPVAERNATCLECHQDDAAPHWGEGAHGKNLACNDCHVLHRRSDPQLAHEGQAARCGTCHDQILETAPVTAAHRLTGSDAMACGACHDPHGPTSLAACVQCHPQDAASLARQPAKARSYHERAVTRKIDCTACHKGFVHALPVISRSTPVPVHQ